MAVLGSILLNRTLKQFLDCQDLESSKGVELTEKIKDSASDSMGVILKSIPSIDNPHSEILIDICAREAKGGLVDVLLENLDDDITLTREIATRVLTKTSTISSTRLFKRLHETDVSKLQIIEILELQNRSLKPEEIIANAIKLDQDHAEQLLKLIEATEMPVDLDALSFQPRKITNANLKIGLLRYLSGLEQEKAADHIGKFLADSNKIITMEALKSLNQLKVEFDASILLPYLESMADGDREIALKILSRQANPELVVQLAPWMTGKSEWLREALAPLVGQHVNQENLEQFLLRLDLEDWRGKELALKSLQKMGTKQLFRTAQGLVDHKQEFIRDTARQLAAQQADPANLDKVGETAMNEMWQIREQGIALLGNSGSAEALVLLKRSLDKWPESAVDILKALNQLGYIKGLEIAFYCLKLPEALAQRKALETIGSLTTQQYAETVRKNLLKRIPPLQPIVKDTAEEVIGKLTDDFGLSALKLADDFFDTHLVKADQSESGDTLNIEDLKAGDTWMGRFRIKQEIGRGAMGRVFLVEDEMVSESLILKFMHPELTADSDSMARFMREVKYSRMVTHNNVIRIHDLLSVGNLCAISMEYFESRGIDEILREIKTFDVTTGLKVLYQVSEGMVAAHDHEVIHRDLKPSNILMDQAGLVKVVDFGIASASESDDDTITQVDSIIGTPAYLSPERANGMEADYRCDIYALGIIAYCLLTGQLPYQGEALEILAQHIQGKASPIHEVNDSIDPEVGMLVQKMMAPKAENRFQTMRQVSDAIKVQLQKL